MARGLVGLLLVGCGAASPAREMAGEATPEAAAPRQPGYAPEAATDAEGEAAPAPVAAAAEETAAVARPGRKASGPRPATIAEAMTSVRAGEWDDNANYRDFLGYIGQQAELGIDRIDVAKRRFLIAVDSAGAGVPNCPITVSDPQGRSVRLVTAASGRALFFPGALGLDGSMYKASSSCLGANTPAETSFRMEEQDGAVALALRGKRAAIDKPAIDVLFVIDTTGSMSEEIKGVKDTLRAVISKVDGRANVRAGVVEYKDKTDKLVTKIYPMTRDLSALSTSIGGLSASGGGDTPENVNAALAAAVNDVAWDDRAVARLAFVIADAPPHLDYADTPKYSASAKRAAERGIKLFTISASGMDDLGQAVFRQVAQVTGGTNMFVLRGGAGEQSTGAGDAKSSCGGTHKNFSSGNLDELIVGKIGQEIASLRAKPMIIPGVGEDENAKPCEKRVLLVAD